MFKSLFGKIFSKGVFASLIAGALLLGGAQNASAITVIPLDNGFSGFARQDIEFLPILTEIDHDPLTVDIFDTGFYQFFLVNEDFSDLSPQLVTFDFNIVQGNLTFSILTPDFPELSFTSAVLSGSGDLLNPTAVSFSFTLVPQIFSVLITDDGQGAQYDLDLTVTAVPLPVPGMLLATALLGLGFLRHRRKHA